MARRRVSPRPGAAILRTTRSLPAELAGPGGEDRELRVPRPPRTLDRGDAALGLAGAAWVAADPGTAESVGVDVGGMTHLDVGARTGQQALGLDLSIAWSAEGGVLDCLRAGAR